MITFRISILLAFSLLPKKSENQTGKKGKKGKNDNASKKKRKDNKSKSDKSSKSGKRTPKDGKQKVKVVVENPKYLFEVGNPVGFSHIEYELIPGRLKYQIDVVCWGLVAKVFSADGEITLKTFVKNEMAWVPITVRHVLNQLEESELLKLYSHVVNYTIWTSKNKLGARAKSENTKAFFIRKEDIDSAAKFTEAYNADPNLEKCADKRIRDLEKEIKNILWECADNPGTKNYEEIVTCLEFLYDPLHRHHINKIIDTVTMGKVVECKDLVPVCPPPLTDEDVNKAAVVKAPNKKGKKGKAKDSKQSKQSTKTSKSSKAKPPKKPGKASKGEGLLKISIPGEVFYTDPCLNIYDLKTSSSDVTNAFILTTTTDLMSRLQKYQLNPLIIKIKKISNLPVHLLKNHRFSAIYAYYNVPYIARCSTIQKPLENVIKFNEAHAHFTNTVPKRKFFEFMQTQRLQVEIRGVREEQKEVLDTNLFGCEESDVNISRKLSTRKAMTKSENCEEPSTVTLAVACYDISSLLKPTWDFKEKASSHHPDNLLFQKVDSMYENFDFTDTFTINEINLRMLSKPKNWSPLTENILTDFGTTLKVEVYLSAPYHAFLDIQSNPTAYFQRLFAVVKCRNMAMMLLNGIMVHNQNVLGPEIYITNFLKGKCQTLRHGDALKKDLQRYDEWTTYSPAITGFIIDNGNSFAFFIEGMANDFVADIWYQIQHSNKSVARIFYNSEFCFEQRLYLDFLNYGGIYPINLKVPLEQILSQEGIYLEGNVPLPGWEALKKLNILMQCSTLRTMVQYCLFPTSKQLLSMAFEWGVPFKWRNEVTQRTSVFSAAPTLRSDKEKKRSVIITELYLSSSFH